MKRNISIVLIMSLLLLSLLVVPVEGAVDGGKVLVKEMVQAPADYSVGVNLEDYFILDLRGRGYLGYYHAYDRMLVYIPDWVFWRLGGHAA